MKKNKEIFVGLMGGLFSLASIVSAQTTRAHGPDSAPDAHSTAPFHESVVKPSSPLLFLVSETGKKIASNFPPLAGYLAGMGVKVQPSEGAATPLTAHQGSGLILQDNIPCDAPAGALFNLEPATGSPEIRLPVPQLANAVDYIPHGGVLGADLVLASGDDYRGVFDQIRNGGGAGLKQPANAWGFTISGYYVHRAGADCSASFEGALPHIPYPPTKDVLFGYSPTVAVDSTRNQAYAVDVRFAATINGLGLFSTTASKLNNATRCANGTHLTDSNGLDTTAASCWPTAALLNPQRNIFPSTFSDKPHLGVDSRSSGLGAGDVYVSWTNFDLFNGVSHIQLLTCPYNFKGRNSCSEPFTISANDPHTQYSHIAIRPDGVLSVTYVSINLIETSEPPYERQTFDIRHVSCTPQGAPLPPTCSTPSLIAAELWPIPFASGPGASPFDFPPASFPVHDYRVNGDTSEEFVAWARCKVDPYYWVGGLPFENCVDSDVVVTWSATDAAGVPQGWATPTFADERKRHQLMPSLKTDHSRNTIELVYLNASQDVYSERYLVSRREIAPGSYAPGASSNLISVPIEPSADAFLPLFIGDSLGLSAQGGRSYVSFTGEAYTGIVRKNLVPGNNNLLLRVDH